MRRGLAIGMFGCAALRCSPFSGEPDDEPSADAGADVVQEAGEGADSAMIDAGWPRVPEGGKAVFMTSTTYSGNLGGLVGADQKCVTRAGLAGLQGVWTAWLSNGDGGVHAFDRVASPGTWYLLDGRRVGDALDLSSATLDNAIGLTESGEPSTAQAWTGTGVDGRAFGADCVGWTSELDAGDGRVGTATATNGNWTSSGTLPCSVNRRLYCFQR
jgi:hypothetical protein